MKLRAVLLCMVILFVTTIPNQRHANAQTDSPISKQLFLTDLCSDTSVPTSSIRTLKKVYPVESLTRVPSESGIQYFLPGCVALNIPNCPVFPYEKVEWNLKHNETVTYLKIKSIKTVVLPDVSIPFALAQEPKPIAMPYQEKPIANQAILPGIFPEMNANFIVTQNDQSHQVIINVMPLYKVHQLLVLATEMVFEIGIGQTADSFIQKTGAKEKSIILTDISLESTGKKLQAIHQADGYETELVFVQQIESAEQAEKPYIAGVQGFMDVTEKDRSRVQSYNYGLARKIQTWLQQQKTTEDPVYLTILGDASLVPPSYYLLATDNMSEYDRWVPTEYFYICPSEKAISLQNATMQFDYRLGRLPVRDTAEAEAMVNKIQRYRAKLNPEWFRKFAVFAGDPFNDDFFGELSTSKAINANYLDGFEIQKYYRSEGLFSTDPFLKVMGEGKRGLVWGFGHGSGDGLALEPGYADARNIMALPEKDEYPIFISEACGNGAYDSRLAKGPFGSASAFTYPTSFSEAIMNSKGGGIAYVGGARINYAGWSLSYTNGIPILHRVYYMDAMLEYFVKNLTLQGGTLGNIAQSTLKEYAENDWFALNAPLVKTFFGFCLQGDPTIRLPKVADGKSEKIPELTVTAESPKTSRQIPLFSIDNGADISVKTDAKKIRTLLVDYNNAGKRVLLDDWVDNPNQALNTHVKTYPKSRLALRLLTPDGKENRIVFFGRYNHDIVIRKSYDLDWIQQDEKKSFYCQVHNDGLSTEQDIQVTVKRADKVLLDQILPEIPVMGSRYVYYQVEGAVPGEESVEIAGTKLPGETVQSDNVLQFPLIVTEKKPFRVGVLNATSLIDFNYYQDRLMLKALNEYFRDHEHLIDISIIPIGLDRHYQTAISRMQYDAVLLYSSNAFYYPTRELISLLTTFSNEGGLVFAMLPLGTTGEGISLQPWQSFFGISPQEKFQQFNLENKPKTFEIKGSGTDLFPQASYQLSSRYTCKPPNKNWDEVELTEEGELIGLSETGLYGLVKNGNRYLYSGFISELDMKKTDDSMVFFEHLFAVLEKDRTDMSLLRTKVISYDAKSDLALELTVCNTGNQTVESCSVLYEGVVIETVTDMLPKTKKTVMIKLPADSFDPADLILFSLQLPEPLHDENPLNDSCTLMVQPVPTEGLPLPELAEDPNLPDWVGFSNESKIVSPSCIDMENDTLYISQASGILELNADGQLQQLIPYDPSLIEAFGADKFRELSALPGRTFLRKSGHYIVISGIDKIAVCEYPSGKLIRIIENIRYENYAAPLTLFNQLFDIEIAGTTAYVLDPYFGLSLIDIESGLLLTKIPVTDYLWDIGIQGDQIAGCTFYGYVFTMKLNGTQQKFYDNNVEMYCNSFLYASENEYYINTYLPDRTVMKVSLDKDMVVIEEKIEFPSTLRGYLERMLWSGQYYQTICYNIKRTGSFGIESKWIQLDHTFDHPFEPAKDHLREILKDKNYMTHPDQVWLTEDNQVLVGMEFPSNPYMFKLFDSDGILLKNIKAGSEVVDYTILHKQYIGNQKIGIIFENRGYWIHTVDFSEKRISFETVLLNTSKARCNPEKFLFSEEAVITLDQYSGNVIRFDRETGLESDRFELTTASSQPTLYRASDMQAFEDQLYLLDPYQHQILQFELSSGSFIRSIPLPNELLSALDALNPLSLKVTRQNEFLLLDTVHSQLYYWQSNYWVPMIHDQLWQHPISMDARNGYLIVNDIGHERLQLYKP